jgi:PEGA domain
VLFRLLLRVVYAREGDRVRHKLLFIVSGILPQLMPFASRSANAAPQKRLAVLELDVQPGLVVDRHVFSARLQNAATKIASDYIIMTAQTVEVLVTAAGKTLADCEGQCAIDTGKLIGADVVAAGRISRTGRLYSLSLQMYDTAQGRLISGIDVSSKSLAALLSKTTPAGERLFNRLEWSIARADSAHASIGDDAGSQSISPTTDDEVLVSMDSDPADSTLSMDGKLLCQATPCAKMVARGPHDFVFEKEGYERHFRELSIIGETSLHGRLRRIFATASIRTDPPNLLVSIDGANPMRHDEPFSLKPGNHTLLISDPCFFEKRARINLQQGEDREVTLSLRPKTVLLKVIPEDDKENVVKGRAAVDGKELGPVPETYAVSICAHHLEVSDSRATGEALLSLQTGGLVSLHVRVKPLLTPEERGHLFASAYVSRQAASTDSRDAYLLWTDSRLAAEGVRYESFSSGIAHVYPVFDATFTENGVHKYLIITEAVPIDAGSTGEIRCHACISIVGAILFAEMAGHWELAAENKIMAHVGSTTFAGSTFAFETIGPNLHGVVVKTRDMHQGYVSAVTQLIVPSGGKIAMQTLNHFEAEKPDTCYDLSDIVVAFDKDSARAGFDLRLTLPSCADKTGFPVLADFVFVNGEYIDLSKSPNASTAAPTFKCARSLLEDESKICKDPKLAALDRHMNDLYVWSKTNKKGRRSRLVTEQRDWLVRRHACVQGPDVVACISARYIERIQALFGDGQQEKRK